jgi:hypothetical protein
MDAGEKALEGHRRTWWQAEEAIAFVRPLEPVGFDVQYPAPDMRHRLRPIEGFAAFAQRFFLVPHLGDVMGDAEHADQAAIGRDHRHLGGSQQRAVAVVGIGDPLLVDRRFAGGGSRTIMAAEEVSLFPGHEVVVGHADYLGFALAEELFELAVAGQINPFGVLQPDQIGDGSNQRLEQFPFRFAGFAQVEA